MNILTPKQPDEEYYIGFDFEDDIGTETISSAVVTATCEDVNVTDTFTVVADQTIINPIVYVKITGGTSGSTYKLECKVTGSEGSIYEMNGYITVLD